MMIWNSVNEKLPEVDLTVLLHDKEGRMTPGELVKRHKTLKFTSSDTTHWMYLPKRPKV